MTLTRSETVALDKYLTREPDEPMDEIPIVAMIDVLNAIFPGYNWDDSVENTAERFVNYLKEYSGEWKEVWGDNIPTFNFTTFDLDASNQMVMCGPIQFASICKHHLLPFLGHVWVAYISNDTFVGLSKLPRVVKWLAKRPQTQEVMTSQILKYLKERLSPRGVMVVARATHSCMSCRGVRETDAKMYTSLPNGDFLTNQAARMEFLHFMQGG